MSVEDYKSETAEIDYLGDLTPEEGESIVGKTVAKVINTEYGLRIIFLDKTEIEVVGSRWGDCALGVDYKD